MRKFLASAALLAAASVPALQPAFAQMVQPTRFGLLSTNAQNILQLDGKPFEQAIVLAHPDHTMVRFELDGADVIFFRQDQGSDCPQKFAIVRITQDGATGINDLGTCSTTPIQPWRDGEVIRFSQPETDNTAVIHYEFNAEGVMAETRSRKTAALEMTGS